MKELLDEARSLNAVASVDPGAMSGSGSPVVLVKDNIAVSGMTLSAGTPMLATLRALRDAASVRLLREKGARFPVKTTLHELAFGITGINGWTGAIANPHDKSRIAGGSSGGSAAALALGLGDLSLVTDTGGSARVPAALCGVMGFRPSTGRYPMDGVIGLSASRDTVGLMARDFAWIKWADAILAGEAPYKEDAAKASAPITLGILADARLEALAPAVADAYRKLCGRLQKAGFVCRVTDLALVEKLDEECGFPIALYETYHALLATIPALTGQPFEALLEAVASPDVAALLRLAAGGAAVTPALYAKMIGHVWPELRAAYGDIFAAGIDAILTPTTPMTASPISGGETVILNGKSLPAFPTYTSFTRPDSMAGLPSCSFPVGRDEDGLPIGMMLAAARFQDRKLIGTVEAILKVCEIS